MRFLQKILFIGFCCLAFDGFAQVGINTITPLSTLDINGNLSVKALGVPSVILGGSSGNAKPITDGVYISMTPVTASGADGQEFILPNAASFPGRIYILRNISNSIDAKLYTFGGAFFAKDSNTATATPLTLPANAIFKTIIVISDGANWTYFF